MDEIVGLYSADGHEIGTAPRSQVRASNLHHAASAVVVVNHAGQVYVHQRTQTKDLYPGLLDFAAGGVVQAGEDPWEAAQRELSEELGLSDPLRRIGEGEYTDAHTSYHGFLAWVLTAGTPVHQPEEVADGGWWEREALLAAIAATPERFMPDTVDLLGEWLASLGPHPHVRTATSADLQSVRELTQLYQGTPETLEAEVFAQRYSRVLSSDLHALFLAEVDGAVAGYALAQDYGPGLREGFSVGRFHDLYVRPDARGRGAGEALVRAIDTWARARDPFILDWQASPGAASFYQALGYSPDFSGDFADYPAFCIDTRSDNLPALPPFDTAQE